MNPIDISLEENKECAELLKTCTEKAEAVIKSWEDLYSFVLGETLQYTLGEKNIRSADIAVCFTIAFIIALRMLPEEGDALTIAKKTLEVALTRPDLTNVNLFSKSRVVVAVVELQEDEGIGAPEPVENPGDKRMLH